MKSTVASLACWSERYERLRRHFLDQSRLFELTPSGLTTLIDNGLAHWMRRWSDATLTPELRRSQEPPAVPGRSGVSGSQLQLTLLLAEMATAHLPTRSAR
jgi:hypothetical protein